MEIKEIKEIKVEIDFNFLKEEVVKLREKFIDVINKSDIDMEEHEIPVLASAALCHTSLSTLKNLNQELFLTFFANFFGHSLAAVRKNHTDEKIEIFLKLKTILMNSILTSDEVVEMNYNLYY